MFVTAGASDIIIGIRETVRGETGRTKVKRYWPGKAPEWADEAENDEDIGMTWEAAFEKGLSSQGGSDIARNNDARMRRLAKSRVGNREEVRENHRLIRQSEIVSTVEEENRTLEFEDDDEDAFEEERRRIREKNLQRQKEDEALLTEEEDEAEEEESEYETESEEETTGIAMVKPVFVLRCDRDTIVECEEREMEERALKELVKKKLEKRKLETKQIVVEKIQEEEIFQKTLELEANNAADEDTDDDINKAEKYEAWKSKERARNKREREEREKESEKETEKEQMKRLRNMTEKEREEWERINPRPAPPPKQKWKFMQKYYHKGVFFQSGPDDRTGTPVADSVYHRDFSAPTGEDKLDKSILPKVMQVKRFGRIGRTKWTHLVNEDTTDWNNPWTYNDTIRYKYNARMAAMNPPIAKPMGKKLKDWRVDEAIC